MVLSPQRRSFGSGCQVAPSVLTRCAVSPLENKENESLRLGSTRRIGSGRIMATRGFERDVRADKERIREREIDFKDKRFRVLSKTFMQCISFSRTFWWFDIWLIKLFLIAVL